MHAWRILNERHATAPLNGEGARLHGGRWNQEGTPVVYLAESQALAALEILVHVEEVQLMPVYAVVEVMIPSEFVLDLDEYLAGKTLHLTDADTTAVLGSRWADSMDSLALRVPSRVIPGESIFVLNPRHESISEVTHSEPRPFQFDPRLLR